MGAKALDETFNFTKENDNFFLFFCDILFRFAGNIHPQCIFLILLLLFFFFGGGGGGGGYAICYLETHSFSSTVYADSQIRGSFEHPKHKLTLMGKKIIMILH